MALGNNLQSTKASEGKKIKIENKTIKQINKIISSQEDDHAELDDIVEKTDLFCVFESGDEKYAIPMKIVKEVIKMPERTPIPQMPNYFSTMTNVRGVVYGVLDLSLFFHNNEINDQYNYLLVINDEEFRIGITLGSVPNTIKVSSGMIEEISSSSFGSIKGKKYLKGIVKHKKEMIILFDIMGMISSKKFTEVF